MITVLSPVKLRVLSLGAGVQSTTLALMAAHGEIGPMPDCAIFADTVDEPARVYEHLRWLMSPNVLPFPVHIVTAGHLGADMLSGKEEARIPFFIKAGGLGKRQCTRNYKLWPIRKKIRELLGVGPRGYIAPGSVEQWVGISIDEAVRLKPSGVAYIRRRDPLIEERRSRAWCEQWLRRNDYPVPQWSACVYCPFLDNKQRRQLRDTDPDGWAKARSMDHSLRTPQQIARFRGEMYVHKALRPLDEVDLSPIEDFQISLFGEECEGMCGL